MNRAAREWTVIQVRMIDADALKDNMFSYAAPEMMWDRGDIEHKIDEMPTIDVVPVAHGRWIDHKDEHQCSKCKEITIVDFYVWMNAQFDYCPYCGAKNVW